MTFDEWFIANFGKQPSGNIGYGDLVLSVRNAEYVLEIARRLQRERDDWDTARKAAKKAWCAPGLNKAR